MKWRMMRNDLPPWHTAYKHTLHWLEVGVFEDMVHDLHMLMRELDEPKQQLGVAILDSRGLQSNPEGGGRAAYDGHKRREGRRCTCPLTPWANCWR